MHECCKCKKYGLRFNRNYTPIEFLEGQRSSKVWIIGLNPAAKQDWTDSDRYIEDLSVCFDSLDNIPSYFRAFKKVSPILFDMFGKEKGVAHTDLVKCSSKSWPPESCKGKKSKEVINNCKKYLIEQINLYKPKLIICNGAPVSREMMNTFPPVDQITDTCYLSNIENNEVYIILAGFVGRVDNYARRRLGYEIENILKII